MDVASFGGIQDRLGRCDSRCGLAETSEGRLTKLYTPARFEHSGIKVLANQIDRY